MGPIHKRQTLKFQVLIWSLLMTASLPVMAKTATPTSKVSPQVESIVQKASKKKDFKAELKEIEKLKGDAVPSLIAIFKDSSREWRERWFTGMALAKYPEQKATKEALIQGTKDTLSIIRSVSVQALGSFEGEDCNKAVQNALDDTSLMVRDSAVKTLAKFKDRDAVEMLGKELFNQRNYYKGQPLFGIRRNIVVALGEIGSMKGVDPLIKVLKQDSDQKLQTSACTSLEKIVKPEKDPKTKHATCTEYWLAWSKNQK